MFHNFEYHSWYLRQISLQIILLPILIQITRLRNKRALIVRIEGDIVFRGKIDAETRAYARFLVKFYFHMCTQKNLDEVKILHFTALYERKHVMVSVKIDQWGRKSLGGHGI